jgi:glutamate carboxypeptidase
VAYSPAVISDRELADLRSVVEASQPTYMADLERLVNIDCGTYTKTGVDEVGRWLAGRLTELGASVRTEPNAELGDCVVGEWHGGGAVNVLLVGHLDTVFEPGTVAQRPFTVRGGRAYGPGVADMKSGLLGGLYALQAVRSVAGKDGLPFGRLVFIGNPDEEIGSPASTPLIEKTAAQMDFALVLEEGRANGDIVSARKGVVDIRMHVEGRAAHAGVEPDKGRSAVVEAAHKVLALTALNGRWPGVTVNVGAVSGGTRANVVAEHAQLEIDLRATSRTALEQAEAEIRAIAAQSTIPDVQTSIELRGHFWPMEKTSAGAALVDQAVDIAGRLGFVLHDAATGGASDANTTSGAGVPSLDGLGPVGGNPHSPAEYIELDSIVPRTTLVAALLLELSRSRPPHRRSPG